MAEASIAYPAKLSIDYPDRELNRFTTFFRLFTIIPILIILALLIGAANDGDANRGWNCQCAAIGSFIKPASRGGLAASGVRGLSMRRH